LQNRVEELVKHSYHPLDPEASAYLKGVLGSLGGGEIVTDPNDLEDEDDSPRIMRDPVVFARLRSIGQGSTIKAILADIEKAASFPASLERIVGVSGNVSVVDSSPGHDDAGPANEDTDVLFAKEANVEQLNLAKQLDRSPFVPM